MRQTTLLRPLPSRRRARAALLFACLGVLAAGAAACADETQIASARDDDDTSRAPAAQEAVAAPDDAATAAEPSSEPVTRPPLATVSVPTTLEDPKVAPWFKVYRPTDMKALGRPLPVVAWANGGCFRAEFPWEPLYKRWAAAGMIVLALTAAPQDGLLGALGSSNVAHHRALIEWAIAQNEKVGSPYYGLIDTKALVAAGNSCGGVTALGAAAEEPRINAVFVLSGSSALAATNRTVMGKIKVPVGYVVGGKEDIAGPNAVADYDALGEGVPALIVSRTQGDHITVSTTPAILAEAAKISLDWLDFALFRTPSAVATLKSPTVCTGCAAGTWNVKAKNF